MNEPVKIFLYYNTLRYLKLGQLWYQLWYKIRKRYRILTAFKYNLNLTAPVAQNTGFRNFILNPASYSGSNCFTFLNLTNSFGEKIDWEFSQFGKLWNYYLSYFEYLNQDVIELKEVHWQKKLIDDFIEQLPSLENANEPFPTSLRIINWVKYFTANNLTENQKWNNSLYAQLYILLDQLEYHLLGNHLLENGFALTIGGTYFKDEKLLSKGFSILKHQLKEQILEDGAHFELSPMYHCLMLYRLLDGIQYLESETKQQYQKETTWLRKYAGKMLSWLRNMKYADHSLPNFNDSVAEIAPVANTLLEYGQFLGIETTKLPLGVSGYRRYQHLIFDFLIKGGSIGPDYIPGHAHADSFTFECRVNNRPFIVDTGISTYEKNATRQLQRSTQSHNTVVINQINSSEVWGGFRVAKRANSKILLDEGSTLKLVHDGYGKPVYRDLEIHSDSISIIEKVTGTAELFLHFHPDISPVLNGGELRCGNVVILFKGAGAITVFDYDYCLGFNKTIGAKKVRVGFENNLETIIKT